MKRCLGLGLVAALVCGVAAECAVAATGRAAAETASAKVGTLGFTYPDRFAHLDFPSGVLVADYRLSRNSPTVRAAAFPANGVVFELNREPKLQPRIPAKTVRFPLSLAGLGRSNHRPNGQTWELRFQVKNAVYWVIVWFGKTASERDRVAIASVVSSVHSSD